MLADGDVFFVCVGVASTLIPPIQMKIVRRVLRPIAGSKSLKLRLVHVDFGGALLIFVSSKPNVLVLHF